MKLTSLFLVLLLVSVSLSFPVPLYDEEDNLIGTVEYTGPKSNARRDATFPSNTPAVAKTAAQAQFPTSAPNLVQSNDLFAKQATINDQKIIIFQTAFILGFPPTPIFVSPFQDPCELPAGGYTWALTFDYQLNFGPIPDKIEWNVKHNTLAALRPVFAAGELQVIRTPTSVFVNWNLASGSFSEIIINSQPNPTTARAAMTASSLNVWNAIGTASSNANFTCAFNQTISGKVLNSPSATYNNQVKSLCDNTNSFFETLNPDMCGCLSVTTPLCAASYPGMTVAAPSSAAFQAASFLLILFALFIANF